MKHKLSARPSTLIVLLACAAAVAAAAHSSHPDRQLDGPVGHHLAQAELSRKGDGFVLWKAAKGQGATLERRDGFEVTSVYALPDFFAQGFLRSDGRVLLQGRAANGRSLRLVEPNGDELRLLWSSETLLEAGVDMDEVAVARSLDWWYVPEFGSTTVLIRAGRIGELDSLRWTVDIEGADPFSASVADVTTEEAALMLAFSAQGEGFLLEPGEAPRSLTRPAGCRAIHRLEGAADGFWADCDRGMVAVYPVRPAADGPIDALTVDRVTDLRFLSSGRAVGIIQRHGAPGRMTSLSVERRQLRRGPEVPLPAPLGQGVELAGEVALIELEHGSESTRARYQVRILPPELVGRVARSGNDP